ncbi:hypothetical protein [Actinopolymorpha alba]|uniref:hypothetical protein n=1 Tax=Actinopolymorpha alba TaxID=533267 RepID=UPI00036FEFCA|nr:hypothetical protein [Actinopolymorpha alba]
MLAERGIHRSGGNKRLNPFLSEEQRAFLEAIPAAATSTAAISDAVRVLTREFTRRGKALAVRTGATWPQPFEDATIAHLQHNLGVDFRA